MVFLILCQRHKNEVYKNYISNTNDETEAISYLHEIIPNKEEFIRTKIEGQLISAKQNKSSPSTPKKIEQYEYEIGSYPFGHPNGIYAEAVINEYKNHTKINLEKIIQRIEWASNFGFADGFE